MKGMDRASRGDGFGGLLSYLFNRKEASAPPGRLVGGNMMSASPEALRSEFNEVRKLRPEIQKPVWHNSLRATVEDYISDQKWEQIGNRYMALLGWSELHQRVYVQHPDENCIHVAANRIAADGSLYYGQNENLKSAKIIPKLEKEFGLKITPSAEFDEHGQFKLPDKKKPSKKQIQRCAYTGSPPAMVKLQLIIDEAKADKPTATEFVERLEAAGVDVRANIAATGRMNGFSFSYEGERFTGKQLGELYNWRNLQKEVGYEQARDFDELRKRANCHRKGADQRVERIVEPVPGADGTGQKLNSDLAVPGTGGESRPQANEPDTTELPDDRAGSQPSPERNGLGHRGERRTASFSGHGQRKNTAGYQESRIDKPANTEAVTKPDDSRQKLAEFPASISKSQMGNMGHCISGGTSGGTSGGHSSGRSGGRCNLGQVAEPQPRRPERKEVRIPVSQTRQRETERSFAHPRLEIDNHFEHWIRQWEEQKRFDMVRFLRERQTQAFEAYRRMAEAQERYPSHSRQPEAVYFQAAGQLLELAESRDLEVGQENIDNVIRKLMRERNFTPEEIEEAISHSPSRCLEAIAGDIEREQEVKHHRHQQTDEFGLPHDEIDEAQEGVVQDTEREKEYSLSLVAKEAGMGAESSQHEDNAEQMRSALSPRM